MRRLAILAIGLTPLAAPAFADTPDIVPASMILDTGAAQRVESAELLRIYTQEVPAAACFYHNGIAPELSRELLIEAHDGFILHYNALLHGDEALGILEAETRRKTIKELKDLDVHWSEMSKAVEDILAGTDMDHAFEVIAKHNLSLLDEADHLVSVIQAEYSNPTELMQTDVLTIEIAGRLAVLTQRMVKNACKIRTGHASDELTARLTEEIAHYELSLNALLNGMPELGIQPAPTEETQELLREILADWAEVKPTILASTEPDALSDADMEYLFVHMEHEMHRAEDLTHAYVTASKH